MSRASPEFRYAALREMGLAPLWTRRAPRIAANFAANIAAPAAPEPAAGETGAPSLAPPVIAPLTTSAAPAPWQPRQAERSEAPGATARPRVRAETAGAVEPLTSDAKAFPDPAGRTAHIAQLDMDGLQAAVTACRACPLGTQRKQAVFGVGAQRPIWLFVGEAPGAEEDERGEPFVGEAGRLLDNMLRALDLERGREVYIANVLKCRPPRNRNPEPLEIARCTPFLLRQIELLAPRIVVALGRFAAQTLLHSDASVGTLRGQAHTLEIGAGRWPLVVTYHPAYLLRSPAEKHKAWVDLCLARRTLAASAMGSERAA